MKSLRSESMKIPELRDDEMELLTPWERKVFTILKEVKSKWRKVGNSGP